jgi:hypothetical protein
MTQKKLLPPVLAALMLAALLLTPFASADAPPGPFFQGFETDISDWSAGTTRVPSGTDGIASKTGAFHGKVTTQFTRWGGNSSSFPPGGYVTSVAIYLDTAGGFANDTRFDFTSAINNTAGNHRRDFAFNAGYYNDATAPGSGPRFVVSASNGTGRANSFPKNPGRQPVAITVAGWYTFRHTFRDNGGTLSVDLSIIGPDGNVVKTWTLSDPTDLIGTTVGGSRYGWFASNEFSFLAIDDTSRVSYPFGNVVVVSPANMNGWGFFNEGANGVGGFEQGPGTPPLGTGSAFLTVDATGRHNLATTAYAGTRFDQLGELRYSTYQDNNANGVVAISLQLGVDYNLTDANNAFQGRLVFEPYQIPANIQQNVWQTWNPLAGKWWASGAPGNAVCPQSNPCTWQQVLAAFPNAGFHANPIHGLVIFRAGGPWAPGFDGNVDAFTIGVGASYTTYDFEADRDGDGVNDDDDNCDDATNPNQEDLDDDGLGDVCDADDDGDGVNDDVDNCPTDPNADQTDTDGDDIGNTCDADDDGDGVNDNLDNCPLVSNSSQADSDGDGIGNACDPCPNTPGVSCPVPVNKEQCKNNGWMTLFRANGTPFKNQGDCIQYFNTGK